MISQRSYEIYKEIVIANYNYIGVMAQMGMLWWVSSTVFVFTLIKFFNKHKITLKAYNLDKFIGIFITAFIVSIIIFGLISCYYILQIEQSTKEIMMHFTEFDLYDTSTIFETTLVLVMIGTTSFVFFLIIWLILYYGDHHLDKIMNSGDRENESEK